MKMIIFLGNSRNRMVIILEPSLSVGLRQVGDKFCEIQSSSVLELETQVNKGMVDIQHHIGFSRWGDIIGQWVDQYREWTERDKAIFGVIDCCV